MRSKKSMPATHTYSLEKLRSLPDTDENNYREREIARREGYKAGRAMLDLAQNPYKFRSDIFAEEWLLGYAAGAIKNAPLNKSKKKAVIKKVSAVTVQRGQSGWCLIAEDETGSIWESRYKTARHGTIEFYAEKVRARGYIRPERWLLNREVIKGNQTDWTQDSASPKKYGIERALNCTTDHQPRRDKKSTP